MRVRITQIDGKLPNIALMRLSSWHKSNGDDVFFTRDVRRGLFERAYDRVYGSAIFTSSLPLVQRFAQEWPGAILGGTGTDSSATVEHITGEWELCDYSAYPEFTASIGFTARGCRMKCPFCVVPSKEGKPKTINTIADIWRGEGYTRNLHLLDNDFFGQSREQWLERITEMRMGGFKVCFNQGVNVRLITDESAEALASVDYRDDQFQKRRLYTAWDNLRDEKVFFRGVERLEKAGIPGRHLMAYMLLGFDQAETMDRIFHRFNRMVERGIKPYPMVYDPSRENLKAFQRWVIRGYYRFVPWNEYGHAANDNNNQLSLWGIESEVICRA